MRYLSCFIEELTNGAVERWGAGQRGGLSHSRLSQRLHIPARCRGDREASVPHIKTAGVTDRVLLLQASAVCTVHKSSYCVKARTFD